MPIRIRSVAPIERRGDTRGKLSGIGLTSGIWLLRLG